MEPKDIVQIIGALVTVVASLAVSRHQVGKHEERIESHSGRIASLETEGKLLKQKQDSHSDQIDNLMKDLKDAVNKLQQIAIDFAKAFGKN